MVAHATRTIEQALDALLEANPNKKLLVPQSYAAWRDDQIDRAEQEFNRLSGLSNSGLIADLEPRDDLTDLEFVLLDRLIQADAVSADLERDMPSCQPFDPATAHLTPERVQA